MNVPQPYTPPRRIRPPAPQNTRAFWLPALVTYVCTIPVAFIFLFVAVFTDAHVPAAASAFFDVVFYAVEAGHLAFAVLVGSISYANTWRTLWPAVCGVALYVAALVAYVAPAAHYDALLHYH